MAKDVNVDFKKLRQFHDKIQRAADGAEKQAFFEACAKDLAARLYAKVVERTPVGDYADTWDLEDDGEHKFLVESDKEGGTLRRGWTIGQVRREGANFVIEVTNKAETANGIQYASYVEFGHRQTPGRYVPAIGKQLKKSWVPGQKMLTISEKEIRATTPRILEKKLNNWLSEVFSDD